MKTVIARLIVVVLTALSTGICRANITVDPDRITVLPRQAVVVPARQALIYELGNFDRGEAVGVEVQLQNAVYKDLSVYIVDATNMTLFRQNLAFHMVQGVTKKVAPFKVMAKIDALDPYYLVLDNRFANFVNKKVVYQLATIRHLSKEQIEAVKVPLTKAYDGLRQTFEFKDFNIQIRNCGQINAFSTATTGDITLCNEIFADLASRPGAMAAVFFHELGHTLLNLWGYPDYSNEDVADQFAVTMLLRFGGENGRQAVADWIGWFAKHDSRAEAANMLVNGDTHSLSVQRIRNIQRYMQNSADLMRRWDNILYPHMTEQALKAIVSRPAAFDDAAAATRELALRHRTK